MTDIAKTLQKQDPGSALIVLYELEYGTSSKAYFFAGLDENITAVQFRETGGTVRTYTAIPLEAEGFEINSDGAYSRPEISIGNIGNVLSSAIGNTPLEDLVGKRLTRRTTLQKYLVGESGDATPPVEYPKVTYIIDRLKSRNALSVTYELAAPFDVAGVQLPKRQVIGGACPFRYKRAATTVAKEDRVGGCNWEAKFNNLSTGSALFMNRFDEYIVPSNGLTTSSFSSTGIAGNYYTTSVSLKKINADGTTTNSTGTDYWLCLGNPSSSSQVAVISPRDNHSSWRKVRTFVTYNAAHDYSGYTDSRYNDYILYNNVLWQVKKKTQVGTGNGGTHAAIQEGDSWTLGDICGKKILSCRLRFQALEVGTTGRPSPATAQHIYLPFGGFPSVQQRR